MFDSIIEKIKSLYPDMEMIPLHAPSLGKEEEELAVECIRSTFVSSVGEFVNQLEEELVSFTGANYCVAVQSGTSALHLALLAAGVKPGDEVITQSLSFIATANAIRHIGARPVFLDVESECPTLDPEALEAFMQECTETSESGRVNKKTKRRVAAVLPMHTLGLSSDMQKICSISKKYGLPVVEDAAESLGSFYQGRHSGLDGLVGAISFNGNKIMTTGGGGAVVTANAETAHLIKHLSTTGKLPHPHEFRHDRVAFNYRLPNINASLGVAQIRKLPQFVEKKRKLAKEYQNFFDGLGLQTLKEKEGEKSNYWLNAFILENLEQRDEFLKEAQSRGVQVRPFWLPIHMQEPYKEFEVFGDQKNTQRFYDTCVKLPSSYAGCAL